MDKFENAYNQYKSGDMSRSALEDYLVDEGIAKDWDYAKAIIKSYEEIGKEEYFEDR
jgi:hypothetical protein